MGIFFLKSINPSELKQISQMKQLGHKICVLDEEGLVVYGELNNELRYSEDNLKNIDLVFFGVTNKEIIFVKNIKILRQKLLFQALQDMTSGKILQTYLQKLTNEITKEFGKYVFIPTSFGIPNSFLKHGIQTYIDDMKGKVSDHMLNHLIGWGELDLVVFKEYIEFIEYLAKTFNTINFIIRPHPSESPDPYIQLGEKYFNIKVVYKYSVTPWILASKAIIHYRSTTSIESNILGTPTISYIPKYPEYMEKYELIPTTISSKVFRKRKDVVAELNKIFNKQKFYNNSLEKDWILINKNEILQKIIDQIEKIVVKNIKTIHIPKNYNRKYYSTLNIFLFILINLRFTKNSTI